MNKLLKSDDFQENEFQDSAACSNSKITYFAACTKARRSYTLFLFYYSFTILENDLFW